jgi:hypothetical protein
MTSQRPGGAGRPLRNRWTVESDTVADDIGFAAPVRHHAPSLEIRTWEAAPEPSR